jgi:hypothetical protein
VHSANDPEPGPSSAAFEGFKAGLASDPFLTPAVVEHAPKDTKVPYTFWPCQTLSPHGVGMAKCIFSVVATCTHAVTACTVQSAAKSEVVSLTGRMSAQV